MMSLMVTMPDVPPCSSMTTAIFVCFACSDLQQLRDGNALGHGLDRADAQVFHRAVGRQRVEVLHMHEADDAVLVARGTPG